MAPSLTRDNHCIDSTSQNVYPWLCYRQIFLCMQTDETILQEIKDLVLKHPKSFSRAIQKNTKLDAYIQMWTQSMPDIKYNARIWYALNKWQSYVKCSNPNCHNDLSHSMRFRPLSGPISTHCCCRCAQLDPKTQQSIAQTSLARYGASRPQQSSIYKKALSKKLHSMPQQHYIDAQKRREATCLKKYGTMNVSQVACLKQKAVQSFKSRPEEAIRHQFQQANAIKTILYGDAGHGKKVSATKRSLPRDKIATSTSKRMHTSLQRYGCRCPSQSQDVKSRIRLSKLASYYESKILHDYDVEPLFTLDEFVQNPHEDFMWKCKKCGRQFKSRHHMQHSKNLYLMARCLDCYPKHCAQSKSETQVLDFVKSTCRSYAEYGNREVIAPKELDIYVPSKKFAIEYNGVAWHSTEKGTPIDYHLQKTQACQQQGVFLLHLFDIEWLHCRPQVEAFIQMHLGLSKAIDARLCKLKMVDTSTARDFYRQNSFIYYNSSLPTYGLFLDCSLVSCVQSSTVNRKTTLLNLWHKIGCDVQHAIEVAASYCSQDGRRVLVDVDSRLWPTSILDGIRLESIQHLPPQKWFAVRSPKNYLMPELSDENAEALHYTIYDSGHTIAAIR